MDTLLRIQNRIKEKGWSGREFARRTGLSVNTMAEWRAGRNQSYLKHLPKIAEVLEVSVAYLLGETDEPTPAIPIRDKDIDFKNLEIAVHRGELEDLTEEEKEQIAAFIRFVRDQRRKD